MGIEITSDGLRVLSTDDLLRQHRLEFGTHELLVEELDRVTSRATASNLRLIRIQDEIRRRLLASGKKAVRDYQASYILDNGHLLVIAQSEPSDIDVALRGEETDPDLELAVSATSVGDDDSAIDF